MMKSDGSCCIWMTKAGQHLVQGPRNVAFGRFCK
jgi:hypothetical protein